MLDWFQLNPVDSSDVTILIQNHCNTTVDSIKIVSEHLLVSRCWIEIHWLS